LFEFSQQTGSLIARGNGGVAHCLIPGGTTPCKESFLMEIEIIESPVQLQLYGLSSAVENHRYGEVGLRLMDQMWKIVKDAKLANTGINHWVYFADDRMFVGVELKRIDQPRIPEPLEKCDFELNRYAKHIHIGPYHELPQTWQALTAELSARGENVTLPSLEVYAHSCEGADESQATTTILMGLAKRKK
jgi:hypothetical protein